jgi:hypothetical protein
MALDEPKNSDDSFDVKGHKFVVDKEFMEKAERIKIDFTGMGFHLDSNMDLGAGADGCGGCSGSCS